MAGSIIGKRSRAPTHRCACRGRVLAEQDRDRMASLVPMSTRLRDARSARAGRSARGMAAGVRRRQRYGRARTQHDHRRHERRRYRSYDALRRSFNVQRGCSTMHVLHRAPVRGRFDHRPMGEILDELKRKVAAGAREIMLVGQTVNAYKEPAPAPISPTCSKSFRRLTASSESRSCRRIRAIWSKNSLASRPRCRR